MGLVLLVAALVMQLAPPPAGSPQRLDAHDQHASEQAELDLLDAQSPTWRDIYAIQASGVLRVGLPADATTFMVREGRIQGFEYDILEAFARSQGLVIQPVRIHGTGRRYAALDEGRVDAIAGRLVQELAYDSVATWSEPLATSTGVIVQREAPSLAHRVAHAIAPRFVRGGPTLVDDPEPVRTLDDLVGRTVVVRRSDGWYPRLQAMGLDTTVELIELPDTVTAEQLVGLVATGQAPLALVRSDLARLEVARLDGVTLGPELPMTVGSRVAFHEDSDRLRQVFDAWLRHHRTFVQRLQRRYLLDTRDHQRRAQDPYLTASTAQLSPYDAIFQREAQRIGWDWRLVAAQAYTESRFKPRARSWAGAVGLMQLMPATARDLRVRNRWDPVENVRGGVDYLVWVDQWWKADIPDDDERLKFVLASYNAGIGHIGDARRLAQAHGDDPNRWHTVAPWLLRLEERAWNRHPVVKYGYCRGSEPVNYVERILGRYAVYRQVVPLMDEAEAAEVLAWGAGELLVTCASPWLDDDGQVSLDE